MLLEAGLRLLDTSSLQDLQPAFPERRELEGLAFPLLLHLVELSLQTCLPLGLLADPCEPIQLVEATIER